MSVLRNTSIKTILFTLLIVSIIGYTYFQMQNLFIGPVITISKPQNGSTLSSPRVEIRGTTANISNIHLNDRQIFIDESGAFKEKLLLSPGYNVFTFQAEDRFGRETKEILELVYN